MGEPFKSEKTVREYLLGRVSDESTLEGIEELLFTDDEFCARVALAEDELVNDYVLGHLDEADAASFRATLADNPERRFALELAQALREKALARRAEKGQERTGRGRLAPSGSLRTFLDPLKSFFRRPKYAGAFALLLLAVLGSAVYLTGGGGGASELAELRAIYRQGRPTETRISEFGHAPLAQLRGEPGPREKSRLRHIENRLIEAAEKSPSGPTHHALGVFYLTQGEYADAVRQFESSLKLDDRSARTHNDLGAAYFELAKGSAKEKRLEHLAHALQEFTTATELDGGSLEALFNRSLALQELGLPREAKESWTLYLRKDPSSPWAEEARRNLARLGDEHARFGRTDAQVLRDFLSAYRGGDEARAQKIHNETKGLLKSIAVPLQLSRRCLLAVRRGDAAEARESVEAMAFIGDFERARHSEFFFLNWRTSTPASGGTRRSVCCRPRTFSRAGSGSSSATAGGGARAIT